VKKFRANIIFIPGFLLMGLKEPLQDGKPHES
jgi:hypothetical protein